MATNAGSIFSEVKLKISDLKKGRVLVNTEFDKIGAGSKKNSKKVAQNWETAFKDIKISGLISAAAITAAFKAVVTTFAETEQALANVRAVTNSTAEEFRVLEAAAESAGQTTRFTAKEAADALFFLASAGLDATQSVEALDSVLLLAGATGSDLAQSAQVVTATLSQYQIATEDAARISNVFAAANANSQATLEKLQNALRQVGPIAGGLGVSLEETVGALELLFNAGFQGEQAGTALRNVLGDLASAVSPTTKKILELGVAFEEIDPATVGITGAIRRLQEIGLSTGQVIEIFGRRAGPQVATLLQQGADALDAYTEAVTDTDEAARQYAIQNDTLAGSFDMFISASESATNSIVNELAPAFRGILDLASGILNFFTGLPGVLQAVVGGLALAAGGTVVLTNVLGLLGVVIAAPLGPIVAIGALIGLIAGFINASEEAKSIHAEEIFGDIAREIGIANEEMEEFNRKVLELTNIFGAGFDLGLDESLEIITRMADELGVSKEEAIALALAAEEVNQANQTTLRALRDQIIEQQIIGSLNDSGAIADEQRLLRNSATTRELRAQVAEAERLAEIEARIVANSERRLAIDLEAVDIRDAFLAGILTEEDSINRRLELREEEIELTREQFLAEEIGRAEAVASIQRQQFSIDGYLERLAEIAEVAEEAEEARAAAAAKANAEIGDGLDELFDRKLNQQIEETKAEEQELARREGLEQSSRANRLDIIEHFNDLILEDEENTLANMIAENEEYIDVTKALFDGLFDFLSAGYARDAEESIDAINKKSNAELEALNTRRGNEKNVIDELKRLNDENLEINLERINQELLAELKAAGVSELTKIESLEKKLDEAIAKGDEETAEELRDQITREQIISKFEDQRIIAEQDAAEESERIRVEADNNELAAATQKAALELQREKDIANARYQAALSEWNISLAKAGVDTAASVIGAIAASPLTFGLPWSVVNAITGAGQIATIALNKPKAPSFVSGGAILPSKGGTQAVLGESNNADFIFSDDVRGSDFVKQFAAEVADALKNAGSLEGAVIQLVVDSKLMAEAIAGPINNGNVKIILK